MTSNQSRRPRLACFRSIGRPSFSRNADAMRPVNPYAVNTRASWSSIGMLLPATAVAARPTSIPAAITAMTRRGMVVAPCRRSRALWPDQPKDGLAIPDLLGEASHQRRVVLLIEARDWIERTDDRHWHPRHG